MTPALQILTLRKNSGLTQKQAANAANVTEQTWRLWEQGRHEPSYLKLPGIARALGVPLGALFAGPDDPRVISEVVVSKETMLKIRRGGTREADLAADRLAHALVPLLMAASRNRPVNPSPRARPRATREQRLLAEAQRLEAQAARLAALNERSKSQTQDHPDPGGGASQVQSEWDE